MAITQEKLTIAQKAFQNSKRGTLWTPRNIVLAALAILYLVSPIDLIPDWMFPFVGWLDDLGVLSFIALLIFRHRGSAPLQEGEQESEMPPPDPSHQA